mgnify:CR=1 FL=1
MQKQSNIRILEILKYLYLRTDEEHPVTVADILDYLKGKGIYAVQQTVYGDLQDLILSSAQYPFQLLAVSRPVDISPLLSELSATLTSSSDVKQKELLKQEIVEMGAFALSGEVVERQFYIKIWDMVSIFTG